LSEPAPAAGVLAAAASATGEGGARGERCLPACLQV
jgi:hypothetical protein